MKIIEIISKQLKYHDVDIACSKLNSTIDKITNLLETLREIDDRATTVTQLQYIDTIIIDLQKTIKYSIEHCIKVNRAYSLTAAATLYDKFDNMVEFRKSFTIQ